MIKREDLEPILSELLTEDNTADIIEKLASVDIHEMPDRSEWDRQKEAEISAMKAEWNDRFKRAFFGRNEAAQELASEGEVPAMTAPNEATETRWDLDNLLYGAE